MKACRTGTSMAMMSPKAKEAAVSMGRDCEPLTTTSHMSPDRRARHRLGAHEDEPALDAVGEHAAEGPEEQRGQVEGRRDDADLCRRRRELHRQPGQRHEGHPHGQAAEDHAHEVDPEARRPKRSEAAQPSTPGTHGSWSLALRRSQRARSRPSAPARLEWRAWSTCGPRTVRRHRATCSRATRRSPACGS